MSNCCSVNNQNQPCEDGVTVLANVGGGVAIGQSIVGNTLNLKTLLAGSGISTSSTPNTITITNTGVSSIVNVGSGSEIASLPFVNPTLNLRTIRGIGGTTVTQTVNTVDVSTPAYTFTTAIGSGSTLVASPMPNAQTKVLAAGTGITLVNSATTVTINNSQTAITAIDNRGLGPGQVLLDVFGAQVRARSLRGNSGITITTVGNEVNINGLVSASIGGGTAVYRGLSGSTEQFASLTGTGSTTVSTDGSNIFIDSPIINTIPYSGKTILNTYLSGNPQISDFIGFGNNALVNLNDAFPADITTLPDAFIGWVVQYSGQITRVDNLIKFSIPTTVTEQVDIYCGIFRCEENDIGMNLIWFDLVFSTTSNISVGDFVQRSFTPNADVEVGWTLYLVFFAHRPTAAGSVDPIEFYTSTGLTLRG